MGGSKGEDTEQKKGGGKGSLLTTYFMTMFC